ncbi:hypothetical protein GCM10010168_57620 [Actinoplanes ianthinogenes]|uniref:Effector-associated domain-containing protein n=1 Tax=Actinoplanes ianthinogenes TaxID=122358 RepID=A0ABN6CLA8_9ACTN|nr:effector-associated domain EAD1-containing protein [Actinoplanes ianthinogenes]BCJ45818.1 hypothetical protein Aiant_64750 [Actinoplanes ianthinogenes]GGR31795.1 hypothetical protein GCM10010168_57620 [Actinoplanes ianthinogenes]
MIDGRTARLLSESLMDAFPRTADLEEMLYFQLDRQLARIVSTEQPLTTVVFRLIRAADSEGWLDRLVQAARDSRPAHPGLFEVAQSRRPTVDTGGLESILSSRNLDIRPALFREALARLEGQICLLEERTAVGSRPLGTGFLIGPDRALTSYHVVRKLIDRKTGAGDVVLRFDHKHPVDGGPPSEGTAFGLAPDWLVAAAPNAAFEELPGESAELPAAGELDFAVLRIAGSPGEEPIGAHPDPRAGRRGWITTIGDVPRRNDDILVLQHLLGRPMRLAFGKVLDVNANGTRLRHTADTDEGSSGSPCFTLAFELVAIHQAGDPNQDAWRPKTYNRAVPARPVFNTL